jgi:prepilin-type N-terminal cleavage/methylation domain-containing protein
MRNSGFTLSELLIALAILGVIATFTIPKVLQSQQDGKYKATVKEALATMAEAYQSYKLKNAVDPATFSAAQLTPYLNYVKIQTTGSLDRRYGQSGTLDCAGGAPCVLLHSGAGLFVDSWFTFGQATNRHYIVFSIDPDGKVTDPATAGSTTNGPGKGMDVILYYNGKIMPFYGCQAGDYTYYNGAQQD